MMEALALIGQLLLATSQSMGACGIDDLLPQLKIRDVRSHLFYEHSARLSEDITQMPQMVLWNSIVGGGDVAEPANHLFVVVVLKGPPGCYAGAMHLRLEATNLADGERFFEQTRALGLLGADGEWATPFLLTHSTCYTMKLKATLVEGPQELSETIEFRCGE